MDFLISNLIESTDYIYIFNQLNVFEHGNSKKIINTGKKLICCISLGLLSRKLHSVPRPLHSFFVSEWALALNISRSEWSSYIQIKWTKIKKLWAKTTCKMLETQSLC